MFESEGHLRSVVHETRDLMRVHVTNHIVAAEVGNMNPLVRIRIPRSALGSSATIGVVHLAPTNRNRDAIGESHRESLMNGMRDEIDARERVGNGSAVGRHACIIPQIGVLVKPNAYCRMRPYEESRKRHIQYGEIRRGQSHTWFRIARKLSC